MSVGAAGAVRPFRLVRRIPAMKEQARVYSRSRSKRLTVRPNAPRPPRQADQRVPWRGHPSSQELYCHSLAFCAVIGTRCRIRGTTCLLLRQEAHMGS